MEKTINVFRDININQKDSITLNSKKVACFLDEINVFDKDLIIVYMYILPSFQSHGIKVGMTKCKCYETFWHSIKSRISAQENELALTPEQYVKYGQDREVVYWGICLDAKNDSFKDYQVHNEIKSMYAGLQEKEQERFTNVPVEELIIAFEKCRKKGAPKEVYIPRKEQRQCVDGLLEYFNKYPVGHRFLLNCKMRFGKSFTTYKYCEEANLNKILILTFVPAVESSWQDDLTHIKKEYKYFTDRNLRKDDFTLDDVNEPYVIFLSLQNYLGKDSDLKETKEKIKKLQNVNFDLVILDEYHFGARNTKTQDTFEDLDKTYQRNLQKDKDVVKKFGIKTDKTICLSGTPFKALAKGEFNKENSFTYSYFDEQKNKYPNSDKDDFNTVDSAYNMFPDMKIFGYNMKNLFSDLTASLFTTDKITKRDYFSLNKFFETRKDEDQNEDYIFIYEDEVKKWLEIIKGASVYGSDFPYSNPQMIDNNKHTLWLTPSINSCIAMTKLLLQDNYFKRYQIINLSDKFVGAGSDALAFLRDGITASSNTNKLGTIAITVNKLTIGVTVKEWSSVFVLKDLSSPESYFQSIFRIQTPYTKPDGYIKKYGYVYDFNIDRAAMLLLKYADDSSKDHEYTKLQIAQLIVKYLPIFKNGNMNEPISDSIFYELADYGDNSGIPLSRRIADTSRTTRMLDDDVIAAMQNDPEVSDIIKHVFAHAKFNKNKGNTHLPPPEMDGFETKIAKDGRGIGYNKGLEDSSRFVDFDDNDIQNNFENMVLEYIKESCPKDYDNVKKIWFSNGYKKGYECGVNAPIKKLECGKNDGVNFVKEVRNKFGENVIYNNNSKNNIDNFVKSYLNIASNIPEEYRGMLYKRWYCESFRKAVRNVLAQKKNGDPANSIENTDNVLKHILSRLFEFLYISVYRETTFKEIFDNANPNVFLEAVGITKKDFEVLNKYHIFQEFTLNNYIHDFFVNESLGNKIDLSDEKNKKQYRNSFNWFGYGDVDK